MATLLAGRSAADHADRWRGSWAFEQALIRHRRKRIAVANEDLRRVFSWSGGSRVDVLQPQKQEAKTGLVHRVRLSATNVFSSTAKFVNSKSREHEIGKKSGG